MHALAFASDALLLAGDDAGVVAAGDVAGKKTIDAVRAYQRKAGVPETGQIDTTLVASLSDSPI